MAPESLSMEDPEELDEESDDYDEEFEVCTMVEANMLAFTLGAGKLMENLM